MRQQPALGHFDPSMLRYMDFEDLMRRIGYTFKQRELLETALSHWGDTAPTRGPNINLTRETLELYGDTVLYKSTVVIGFEDFGGIDHRLVAKARDQVKSNAQLTEISRELTLESWYQNYIRPELKSPGWSAQAINKWLADTFEAILGAIDIDCDQDFRTVHQVVRRFIAPKMALYMQEEPTARLFLLCQHRFGKSPDYTFVVTNFKADKENPQRFTCRVGAGGQTLAEITRKTRDSAMLAATSEALKLLDGQKHHLQIN